MKRGSSTEPRKRWTSLTIFSGMKILIMQNLIKSFSTCYFLVASSFSNLTLPYLTS